MFGNVYRRRRRTSSPQSSESFKQKWDLDKGSIGQEPDVKFSPYATTTPRVQRRNQPDSPTRTAGKQATGSTSLIRSTYKSHPGIPFKKPLPSGTFHVSRRGRTPAAGVLDYSQYEKPPVSRATQTERARAGVAFYGEAPKTIFTTVATKSEATAASKKYKARRQENSRFSAR